MNAARLIAAKRDGFELTRSDIGQLIRGFVAGDVTDSQMSAFAMAVFFRGMTDDETTALTLEMLASGLTMSHPAGPALVDKHSTGGVGDKTSLILAPLLASCGLRVPMISGRGLGPTGGTLDKLESISGFRTDLSIDELSSCVAEVGCVITGATEDIVPADRRLYALRDVTATVPSVPLITASIMSKKLAESLNALVLDVKFGSGSFMKTREQATALAESLVRVGHLSGLTTTALITDMNQPLGRMCGNAVEVAEALDVLGGGGPPDVRGLTIALGVELLCAVSDIHKESAADLLVAKLDSGEALQVFERMVAAQGGRLEMPRTVGRERRLTAERDGFIIGIDTEAIGHAIIELGGGRRKPGDRIDSSVGIELRVRIGDAVSQGEEIARIFSSSDTDSITTQVSQAICIGDSVVAPPVLIAGRLTAPAGS